MNLLSADKTVSSSASRGLSKIRIGSEAIVMVVEDGTERHAVVEFDPALFSGKGSSLALRVGQNASLSINFVLPVPAQAEFMHRLDLELDRDARVRVFFGQCSSKKAKFEVNVILRGAGSSVELAGASVLRRDSQVTHLIDVEHLGQGTHSNQVFKSILMDSAVYEFESMVTATHEAAGTVSRQLNKNLLLSSSARAFSRPRLKIDTDDVQCSHGATVGPLNEDEIHYMRSRGISEHDAKTMVAQGFVMDVLDFLHEPALSDGVAASLEEELKTVAL